MSAITPRLLVDAQHGLIFTESPRWRHDRWWFLDIHGQAIKTVTLDGQLETVLPLPFKPNAFGFRNDGSLLVGDAFQRKVWRWDGREWQVLADIADSTRFCFSDGIVDRYDRMYVGDIGYAFWDPSQTPSQQCVINCIGPAGQAQVVAEGLFFPNGMAITPDGRTLIVAETLGHRLRAFDIQPDGALGPARLYAQLPEDVFPDGITLDAEGAVWLATPMGRGGVLRVREGGAIVEHVALPQHAYAVMLGGPERRHLLMCTSASHDPAELARAPSACLYVAEVQVPGAGKP